MKPTLNRHINESAFEIRTRTGGINVIEEVLGGRTKTLQAIRDALQKRRMATKTTPREMDHLLKASFYDGDLPQWIEYERNPSIISSELLSKALFILKLDLAEILNVKTFLDMKENMERVVAEMRSAETWATAGIGEDNVRLIDPQKQAPTYLLIKAVEELDAKS